MYQSHGLKLYTDKQNNESLYNKSKKVYKGIRANVDFKLNIRHWSDDIGIPMRKNYTRTYKFKALKKWSRRK